MNKRQISFPPHEVGFFNKGEFVYVPDSDWETLRNGMVYDRNGKWFVSFPSLVPGVRSPEEPLEQFGEVLGRHVLIDYSGIGPPRGPVIDPEPWRLVKNSILNRLRDAERRRVRLEVLMEELKRDSTLDSDLVEDTMRMFVSMGTGTASKDAGGLWFNASDIVKQGFARKDYLSSFSDELLAKSRRIDNLINHTGTVGSYREELVRGHYCDRPCRPVTRLAPVS